MRKYIAKFWSNEFFKGGVFLTISSFIVNILNYFFNIIAGRSLGPIGYGEIAALFSYVYITAIPIGIFSILIMQKISSREEDQHEYALAIESFFWRTIKKYSWFLILLLLSTPFISRITNLSTVASYFLIPIILLTFIATFYTSTLQGLKLFFIASIIAVVGALIKLAGGIVAIFGFGLGFVLAFLLLSILVIFICSYKSLKKFESESSQKKERIEKRFIDILKDKQVIITAFSILAVTLFSNMDIIFVKKFFLPTEAGIYSSWSLFAKIILYVVMPISSVSFIFFSSKQNEKKQNLALFISLLILAIIGMLIYFSYSIFGQTVINIFFGHKFDAVVPYLGMAGLFGIFYTAITFINNYFLAKKSAFSLILIILLPLYIGGLFLVKSTINNVMLLNIYFSLIVVLVYITSWILSIFRHR